jgi:3alpha(or 20beta)-hydroxysteroid dehydrogenase
MKERLEGKVALITGAAMGQGAAEARLFADHGARVALCDIADTSGVATGIGAPALALSLDVTQEEQWAAAVAATVAAFGRLDILVNNAGIGFPPRPLGEEVMEHHYKVWAVNADGVYLGIRAVAPVMSGQGSGSIVNISSIDGLAGVAGMMSYTASKFAVTGMTRTRRARCARQFHPPGCDRHADARRRPARDARAAGRRAGASTDPPHGNG